MSRWKASTIDVSLALPGVSLSGSWEPDDAERAASWELLVELSTRVSAVDLADDQGTARDALTSLYSLFATTREILKVHGPTLARSTGNGNLSFGVIAVRVLNDVLRPVLGKWHETLLTYENQRPTDVSPYDWEHRWERHTEIRAALRNIRPIIRQYLLVLAEAADVPELAVAVLVPNGGQSRADLGAGWRDRSRTHALALGFRPRHRMVRWFDPGVLARTAWRILRLRRRGDARSQMAPPDGPTLDLSAETGELWFDYVADLGDAFDPTMAVAWHLGRDFVGQAEFALGEQLPLIPRSGLPRGRFLVMGGDEVYPYPSPARYKAQTTGPYSLALPAGRSSTVLAIPGNHDWYDGLDAFSDVFLRHRPIGGWKTTQDASWFSVRLPKGWWIWGLDTGLGGDVDEAQRAWFAKQAALLSVGDRVMVVHPIPAWRLREKRVDETTDDELGRISQLLDEVLPDGVTAPLFLAGDSHIYAHYVQETEDANDATVHHVTSGGGGAFLHPTHNLAPVVPQSTTERDPFQLQSHWPPRPISRHVLDGSSRGLILDRQNVPLVALLALIHLGFAAIAGRSLRAGLRTEADAETVAGLGPALRQVLGNLASSPWTWIGLAVVVLACTFVIPHPNVADPLVHRAARRFGLVHGLLQATVFLVAAGVGGMGIRVLAGTGRPSVAEEGLGLLIGAVFGGSLSVVLVAAYLRRVNSGYRIHDNEAFSGRHIRGYKHFVRCRIDEAGDLRLHVIGLEAVRPGWAGAMADGTQPPTTALALVDVVDISSAGSDR